MRRVVVGTLVWGQLICLLFMFGSSLATATPNELQVTTWYWGELQNSLKEVLEKTAAQYMPGTSLNMMPWGANLYIEKLTLLTASRTAPEIIMTNSNRFFAPMAEIGAYAPLNKDLLTGKANILPDLFEPFVWEGQLLAIPMSVSLTGIYINLNQFRDAGLDAPAWNWDWNDLMQFSKRLTTDVNGDGVPDRYGLSVSWLEQHSGPFIYANGGSYMDRPVGGKRVMLDEPAAIQALEFLQELTQQHRSAVAVGGIADWLKGKYAMAVDGSWQLGSALSGVGESFDWDFVPYPRSPATGRWATRLTVEALALSAQAAGSADALRLAELATSKDAQEALLQRGTIAIPARRDLLNSPYFYPPEKTPRSARRFFIEALTQGYAVPETVYPDLQMRSIMEKYVKAALMGQQSARSAMTQAAQEMRAYLK